MHHEAVILHEKFNKGRKSGHIEIHDNNIDFYDDGKVIFSMSTIDMEITQGGTGNRYVYLKHPDKKDYTIYTDDKKILNYPSLKLSDHQKKAVGKIKTNRRMLWVVSYTIIGVCIASLVLFWIFRGAIIEQVAHQVPVEWEQEVTEPMLESAIAGKEIVEDPVILENLAKITSPLVNAVENKDFEFNFTIVEDETLNAFALPGGSIVIHSGLIQKADHVNEVAGVLAHEICHVTRRHHVRGIVGRIGFFVLLQGFLGDAAGISAELAALGSQLESLKYSRDYETEADENGWALMERANLDPEGMIDFFHKLHHEHSDIPEVTNFMSTHPGTGERIETLKSKVKQGGYTKIDIDFEQFKKDITLYFEVN